MTTDAPPRRTQAERRSATRARLLDATIDCLVEFGYGGTTFSRIVDKADLTRGAQMHHFPDKDDMVLAAVARLVDRQARANLEQLAAADDGPEWADVLLDVLWDMHRRSATFVATAEIWVAARTNSRLAQGLEDIEEVLATANADAVGVARRMVHDHDFREAFYTAMDTMRGLVMSSWHLDDRQIEQRWQRARRHLRLLFPMSAEPVAS